VGLLSTRPQIASGTYYPTYRIWEAIEAGSIPVILEISGEYNNCVGPSLHLAQTVEVLITLRSWEELPAVLEQEMSDLSNIARRQRRLRKWLAAYKATTREQLLITASAMNASAHGEIQHWRPRTECGYDPLDPYSVGDQQQQLAHYWRMPQPSKIWFSTMPPRPFLGPDGFCSDPTTEDWTEPCLAKGCSPPLVGSVWCRKVELPAPDPKEKSEMAHEELAEGYARAIYKRDDGKRVYDPQIFDDPYAEAQ